MADCPSVDVIIPTLALARRADLIKTALKSVLSQEYVKPRAIVVANGPKRDPSLLRELETMPGIRLIEVLEPGIPGALQAGRAAVASDWFAALDDDDILLPGALRKRINILRERPSCETVVTNGFRQNAGKRVRHVKDLAAVQRDPLDALSQGNWLLPGAWLCRSAAIDAPFFEGMPRYLENTYLAIQFSLRGSLHFLQEPTVVWNMDTPGSESKSREYALGLAEALEQLLALPLPARTRRRLRRASSEARHSKAALQLQDGAYADAWRSHLKSLAAPSGWRYLPFGLRILRATLRGGAG